MTACASAREVNFDCLVGPTHHFGGLSHGNLASYKNRSRLSSPKRAALQGLSKMRYLFDRGFVQGILPPHERPHMKTLRQLGFFGDDHDVMHAAYRAMPEIFSRLCSSSAMWAANAATVSPRFDSLDNKTHISPANLITMLHRSIEGDFTERVFAKIFSNNDHFLVHPPLLPHDLFADEGAANHSRLCPKHDGPGLQIFVYGREAASAAQKTKNFPARQSKLANAALARRHRLDERAFLNIEQNPLAIDKGAFHNDVVAVANQNLLLCHELAFVDQAQSLARIRDAYEDLFSSELFVVEVGAQDLPIDDAVASYLFNSQLLSKPNGKMLLFAPTEAQRNERAQATAEKIVASKNPVDEVQFFDVSESMANGGGPACLRLRMVLSDDDLAAITTKTLLTEKSFVELDRIINTYYVDELTTENFFDADFLYNCKRALDEISDVLGLGAIYDFQR